jgi:hypothetical protein
LSGSDPTLAVIITHLLDELNRLLLAELPAGPNMGAHRVERSDI